MHIVDLLKEAHYTLGRFNVAVVSLFQAGVV